MAMPAEPALFTYHAALLLLAREAKCIDDAGEHDDGGAELIVVEHGDIELVDKAVLNLEAARCRDVLQVDAAERGDEALDRLDDLVDVLGIQADGHGVHITEGLEEGTFALHDGHSGLA